MVISKIIITIIIISLAYWFIYLLHEAMYWCIVLMFYVCVRRWHESSCNIRRNKAICQQKQGGWRLLASVNYANVFGLRMLYVLGKAHSLQRPQGHTCLIPLNVYSKLYLQDNLTEHLLQMYRPRCKMLNLSAKHLFFPKYLLIAITRQHSISLCLDIYLTRLRWGTACGLWCNK